MDTITLHPTRCALCGTAGNATEIHPANFKPGDFNPAIFSARRLPDRIHYRMVECRKCGLVRSDPVADSELLSALYRNSSFDYSDELDNLRRTYGRYLSKVGGLSGRKGRLLEIGCGNGFFLGHALSLGYEDVRGVEPGSEAVRRAAPGIRERIVCDVMRAGLFEPGSFDVVCMFQVFDHLPEPAAVLGECLDVLRPGGILLVLNHNIRAVSARLLGEQSPIIDIEHTYLFSPDTMSALAQASGFQVRETGVVWNHYTLHYLARLLPLPAPFKRLLLGLLARTHLARLPLVVPLGNCYLIAQKPA